MKTATFEYPRAYTVEEAAGLTRELDQNDHLTECARRRDNFAIAIAIAALGVAFDVVDGRTRDVGVLRGSSSHARARTVAARVLEGTPVDDPAAWLAPARAAASDIDPPGTSPVPRNTGGSWSRPSPIGRPARPSTTLTPTPV